MQGTRGGWGLCSVPGLQDCLAGRGVMGPRQPWSDLPRLPGGCSVVEHGEAAEMPLLLPFSGAGWTMAVRQSSLTGSTRHVQLPVPLLPPPALPVGRPTRAGAHPALWLDAEGPSLSLAWPRLCDSGLWAGRQRQANSKPSAAEL